MMRAATAVKATAGAVRATRVMAARGLSTPVDAAAERAMARNQEIRANYDAIKPSLNEKEYDEVRRKRLIYRSKQRGWLEVDILMGSWAAKHVPHLTKEEMDDYEEILSEETIDIFNYVSGKDALPEKFKNSRMMKVLQEYAINSGVIDPARYAEVKTQNNLI